MNAPDRSTACYNPATGEVIGYSPLDTVEQVRIAVQRAHAAQPEWARTPVRERVAAVERIRDYLVEHAEEIASTISRDNGKTRLDALATEVVPAALAASYYARHAERFLRDQHLGTGALLLANKVSKIVRVPFGVVGVVSPWNYPFAIPFSEVLMGLLAGNAVLLKVASQTQMVGRELERCIQAGALPEDVFAYLNLPGSQAGNALLEAGIDKLFFTGSVKVGKTIMAKAAETLTPVVLELGGNDPMIVCADADLDRAAAGAQWAGMQNAGQSCGGIERIYVDRAVYQPFVDRLAERVRALRVGHDTDHQVEMGAMTTVAQMETVRRHVADAVSKGAVIYAQSECPAQGNFVPAMVLTNCDHTMLAMREETFGPIVGVMAFDDVDQAVRLANDSDLGLTASVWSRDARAAERIARRLAAGVVTINDHLMSHGLAETPWGGFKQSGLGRTHGQLGFYEMTQPQCIVHDVLPGVKKNMWWHPHDAEIYRGMGAILDLLYSKDIGRRARGLRGLLKIFPRTFSK
ncbi:MAG: aldehyde dehydrogenase family protein [Deltaproteobacteria bacterium]|nr:aldehyde dehydrogenase family protein [Deltaproteobacteria bacterium]